MSDSSTSGTQSPPPGLLRQVKGDLVALTKARLSLLVVMTACFGYLVATKGQGTFSWATLLHLVFGTALAAAGAAVFNQLMEVEADAKMHRTSDRPLPANRLPKAAAFVLGWLLAAFGLIHLGVMVNVPASLMAAATLITYLFIYTPMKRVSTANTLVGAVSGALPPLIGWAAGTVAADWRVFLDPGSFFLFGLLFFWQLPHFLAIAWMYRADYAQAGFPMLPVIEPDGASTARQAVLWSAALVPLSLVPSALGLTGLVYAVGALALGLGYYAWSNGVFNPQPEVPAEAAAPVQDAAG